MYIFQFKILIENIEVWIKTPDCYFFEVTCRRSGNNFKPEDIPANRNPLGVPLLSSTKDQLEYNWLKIFSIFGNVPRFFVILKYVTEIKSLIYAHIYQNELSIHENQNLYKRIKILFF